jgi:polyisoprenoid-binding protein YceI
MVLPIPSGTYGIDTVHSQIGFGVKHLGISVVRGTFDRFSGALFVGETLADTVVAIEAEMASINSGNSLRDQHVHGAEFLDIINHPQMSFRSTSITESGAGYTMTGDLTIKGATNPVVLQASYNGAALFPIDGSTHHGFSATATISRSSFGVSYGVPLVSDEVTLALEVQFITSAVDA